MPATPRSPWRVPRPRCRRPRWNSESQQLPKQVIFKKAKQVFQTEKKGKNGWRKKTNKKSSFELPNYIAVLLFHFVWPKSGRGSTLRHPPGSASAASSRHRSMPVTTGSEETFREDTEDDLYKFPNCNPLEKRQKSDPLLNFLREINQKYLIQEKVQVHGLGLDSLSDLGRNGGCGTDFRLFLVLARHILFNPLASFPREQEPLRLQHRFSREALTLNAAFQRASNELTSMHQGWRTQAVWVFVRIYYRTLALKTHMC